MFNTLQDAFLDFFEEQKDIKEMSAKEFYNSLDKNSLNNIIVTYYILSNNEEDLKDFISYKPKKSEMIDFICENLKEIIKSCLINCELDTCNEILFIASKKGIRKFDDGNFKPLLSIVDLKLGCVKYDKKTKKMLVFIPEEIIDTVVLAIKNVKWNKVKKLDELNEILIGYIKIQGVTLLLNACNVGATILNFDPEDVLKHMLNNKLFNYHVSIITEDIELLGNDVPVVLHNDFYDLKDEIEKLRKEKEITSYGKIDKKLFRTYFYNDFDINNKKINKLIDAVKQLPFSYSTILDDIKNCAMLDDERGPLVYFIQEMSNLFDYDASNILELLDKAMDEIPSGVLNGLSRNQLLKLKQKELEVE